MHLVFDDPYMPDEGEVEAENDAADDGEPADLSDDEVSDDTLAQGLSASCDDQPPPPLAAVGPLCAVCGVATAKYRCPGCERRTCSAPCVAEHKVRFGCTGKRARTEFVAPLRAFRDHILHRDFNLLEDVDLAVDRAVRDFRIESERLRLYQHKRHRQRIDLAQACAAPERRTRLILAPLGLAQSRLNTSRVMGGGGGGQNRRGRGSGGRGWWRGRGGQNAWGEPGVGTEQDRGLSWIAWQVEWRFGGAGGGPPVGGGPPGECEQVFVDLGLKEHEVLGPALTRFLDNTWPRQATRHLLLPHAEAGVGRLEVFMRRLSCPENDTDVTLGRGGEESDETRRQPMPAVSTEFYDKLDKGLSLRENLMGRVVMEFPVLHVALPREITSFCHASSSGSASERRIER